MVKGNESLREEAKKSVHQLYEEEISKRSRHNGLQ